MNLSTTDTERFLRLAIDLASQARAQGNPPYGSLIVDATGEVLATALNTTVTANDITAHPELKLARWVAQQPDTDPMYLSMFTSCQPCSMCANTIARAHIGRVVYALSTSQLQQLKPTNLPAPDATPVIYEGPYLLPEAQLPVTDYYSPQHE